MESEVRNRKARQSSAGDKASSRRSTKKSDAFHVDDQLSATECEVDEELQKQQQQQRNQPSVCQNERVQRRASDEPSLTETSSIRNATKCLKSKCERDDETDNFRVQVHLDLMTVALFAVAFATRIYKLSEPNNIVWVSSLCEH